MLHWRWFGRGQRSWVASRRGRRPVLVVGLPDLQLGRWLGWGEGRRVLHWRWLGRGQGSWVAPRRGHWRWGGVPASRAMHWWGLGGRQGSRVAPRRGGWRRGGVPVSRVLRWWGLGRRRGGRVAPRREHWHWEGVTAQRGWTLEQPCAEGPASHRGGGATPSVGAWGPPLRVRAGAQRACRRPLRHGRRVVRFGAAAHRRSRRRVDLHLRGHRRSPPPASSSEASPRPA